MNTQTPQASDGELQNLIGLLQIAPDGEIDSSIVEYMKAWGDKIPPAIQLLKVLDVCAFSALASDFAMRVMHDVLLLLAEREGKTVAQIANSAEWRKSSPYKPPTLGDD